MINIVEIFKDIVARVSDKVGYEVHYEFGDWSQISNIIDNLNRDTTQAEHSYPLIALYSPFTEEKSDYNVYCKASLNFLIAVDTDGGYNNMERLEKAFKPILHPIYEAFMEEIRTEKRFDLRMYEQIPHKYSENYRYGSAGVVGPDSKTEFNDRIDGIDISDLKITVKKESCK